MKKKYTLITYNQPKSPISEAYRVLRTNIQYSSIENPLKTIVITSSGTDEGKSTTAANLAITFVQSGARVLLVDSDLRKPNIHKIFDLDYMYGLTNILVKRDNYKDYIRNTTIFGLDIITSGAIPPNPSELLGSNQMKQLMSELKEDYDLVILDAPPVCNVTDAVLLSTIVDGTILVASSGTVEIDSLKIAKELLLKVNANIIGVVLNKLDKGSKENSYYNYHYYGEEKKKLFGRKHKREGEKGSSEKVLDNVC